MGKGANMDIVRQVTVLSLVVWTGLSAAEAGVREDCARVYRNRPAPRLSTTGKSLALTPARGSQNVVMTSAKMYDETMGRGHTDDSHFGGAKTRRVLRFTRVRVQSATRPLKNVRIEVSLRVAEGDDERGLCESFDLGDLGLQDRVAIDTEGFVDVTGTEVSASVMGRATTHEKRTHYRAQVKSVVLRVYEGGSLVYAAASTPEARRALDAEMKD
jgi:hypothetical protein